MNIKKIGLILLMAFVFFTGCKDNGKIRVALQSIDGLEGIVDEIKRYYADKDVEIIETNEKEVVYISAKKYDVLIGEVKEGAVLGYGRWKSKPLKKTTAFIIAYGEYKMTSDFSGKKVGYTKGFEYNAFLPLNAECEYVSYEDERAMLDDLKSGVIQAILCTNEETDKYKSIDENFRANQLINSESYETCVISCDMELIKKINNIVGD